MTASLFEQNELPPGTAFSPNNKKMMCTLAGLGLHRDVLAVLLEMGGVNLRPDHLRYFSGPIVTHGRSQWADIVPEWVLTQVLAERLEIILDEHEQDKIGWRVGPSELVAVLMPASMEAPMMHEYAQIYLWAAARAKAAKDNISVGKIWHVIGGEPVTDAQITKHGSRYYYEYQRLCSDIRRRVVRAQEERDRKPRQSQPVNDNEPDIQIEQLNLFT